MNPVTAVLSPYNPQYGSSGIPAEQVDVDLTGTFAGQATCEVEVLQGGAPVGSTTASLGLPTSQQTSTISESVNVCPLSVPTLNGTASDATVNCHG